MTEKQIVTRFQRTFKAMARKCKEELFLYKVTPSTYSKPGLPDIVGCYEGRFFSIEAKVTKKFSNKYHALSLEEQGAIEVFDLCKLTKLQQAITMDILRSGAPSFVLVYGKENKRYILISFSYQYTSVTEHFRANISVPMNLEAVIKAIFKLI